MKICKLILFSILSVFLLTHCQQPTGSQDVVTIPAINVSCSASNCSSSSNAHPRIYIYVTTSGCLNITYGQVATGIGTLSCSGGTCTGADLTWTNKSGSSITQIASDSYSFCAFADIVGGYTGTVVAGDATDSEDGVSVGTPMSPVSSIDMTNWANGPFTH